MRQVVRATSAIVFTLGITLLGACVEKRPVSQYPSMRAAENGGATRDGWIPSGIPASAKGLWEQHDADSRLMFLRFELPAADRAALVDGLRLRAVSDSEAKDLESPRPWARTRWFEATIQHAPSNDNAIHALVYEGDLGAHKMHVVADEKSDFVYVWTTAR